MWNFIFVFPPHQVGNHVGPGCRWAVGASREWGCCWVLLRARLDHMAVGPMRHPLWKGLVVKLCGSSLTFWCWTKWLTIWRSHRDRVVGDSDNYKGTLRINIWRHTSVKWHLFKYIRIWLFLKIWIFCSPPFFPKGNSKLAHHLLSEHYRKMITLFFQYSPLKSFSTSSFSHLKP